MSQPIQEYSTASTPKSVGLVEGRRPPGADLHSSDEPDKLSQWLQVTNHDDSTINIVLALLLLLLLLLIIFQVSRWLIIPTSAALSSVYF